jgi:type I restriction enzyme S subunit
MRMKTKAKTEIPEDWEVVRIGDERLCEIIMGQSPPSSTYNEKNEGLPFLQGNIEFGRIHPSPTVYCSAPIKIAQKEDILISVRAPVGEVNVSPSKLCIGRGLAAIRCKSDKMEKWFLFYLLKHKNRKFESISSGSTFKAIRKDDLEKFELILPPLPEQKAIAQVLSTVDDAIQKVDEIISKTEHLKKGLMQKLLTKGIGHKEFKDTEIGRIPKEWEVVKFDERLVDFKNGINFTKEQKGDKGILTIDVLNMYGNSIFPDFENLYRVDMNLSEDSDYLLKKGDILFVRSSLKREGAAWATLFNGYNEKVTFCGFIIRARLRKSDVLPEFLTYFLRSDFARKRLIASSGQVAITNISQDALKMLRIPLPSVVEQQKIASILSTVDRKLELQRKRKEKLERIKRGFMNDLLTGRKRVKVQGGI